MFVRNIWYCAADSPELGRAPLGRVFLHEPVAMYRTADGTPVALEDRCCHRRAPLSKGKVEGDRLRCGYHGFLYDATGACVWVPGHARVPPEARVKSYPLCERHGLIWIWMGDPARADEATVPDFNWNTAPGWISAGAHIPVRCNYMLLVDNLLDLSHVPVLHANSIGSANDTDPDLRWERGPNFVRGVRSATDLVPSPRLVKMGVRSNIDTVKIMTFTPPAHVAIEITQRVREPGNGPPAYHSFILNSMTPETAASCHYFWRGARDYDIENAELTRFLAAATTRAFEEDTAMLEAEQRIIDLDPAHPQVDVTGDAGGLEARRIVGRLLAAEGAARAAAE